jgi:hypothetical protein
MTELIKLLRKGCVIKPKRWSGDVHSDSDAGCINEAETDKIMSDAADALAASEARARELWEALDETIRRGFTFSPVAIEPRDKHADHFRRAINDPA